MQKNILAAASPYIRYGGGAARGPTGRSPEPRAGPRTPLSAPGGDSAGGRAPGGGRCGPWRLRKERARLLLRRRVRGGRRSGAGRAGPALPSPGVPARPRRSPQRPAESSGSAGSRHPGSPPAAPTPSGAAVECPASNRCFFPGLERCLTRWGREEINKCPEQLKCCQVPGANRRPGGDKLAGAVCGMRAPGFPPPPHRLSAPGSLSVFRMSSSEPGRQALLMDSGVRQLFKFKTKPPGLRPHLLFPRAPTRTRLGRRRGVEAQKSRRVPVQGLVARAGGDELH